MELTKEQSFSLMLNHDRTEYHDNYSVYSVKTPSKCISCGKDILISYSQYGRNRIFCDECRKSEYAKPTMAQLQYMRKIKERQLFDVIQNFDMMNITMLKDIL